MRIQGARRGLIAGLALLAVSGWCALRVSAAESFAAARQQFWKGKLREALAAYETAGRLRPFAPEVLDAERDVYLAALESPILLESVLGLTPARAVQRAGELVARQLDRSPLWSESWSGVADFYAVLKPLNQARRVYSLDEVSPRPEENLEIEDLLQIRALEVATRLDPNGVFYQNRLGELAWSLGLKSLAESRYREAVTLWPEQTKHLFLARLDVAPEMIQATVEGMERAVKPPRGAEPERVYRNLGIFLMEHDRPAEAREAFRNAERFSHGVSYVVWEAAAEAGAGNLDEAIRLYRRSLTAGDVTSDQRFQAQWNLGSLLEQQGRHREAAQELTNALALRPRDTRTLLALGRVYESLGLKEDAEEQYVRASEAGGDRVPLLVNLVDFYRRTGRPADALFPAKKLMELVPDEPIYRQQYGELQKQIEGKGP